MIAEDFGYTEWKNKPKETAMKLIALTGLPRSGKDTFAAHMCTQYGYTKRAFATPLKKAAAILLNREVWEMEGENGFDREAVLPEWGFTTRRFLQWFGTEGVRNFKYDFWIHRMKLELGDLKKVIITDCRFPNEVEFVHAMGGKVIQIVRPGTVASEHASDTEMPWDIRLQNNGTLEQFIDAIDAHSYGYNWR